MMHADGENYPQDDSVQQSVLLAAYPMRHTRGSKPKDWIDDGLDRRLGNVGHGESVARKMTPSQNKQRQGQDSAISD